MANERKYAVAGTSKHKDQTKVRFSQDMANRVKTLEKNGHEDIVLVELPEPMTKLDAALYLKDLSGDMQDSTRQSAINAVIDREETRKAREAKRARKQENKAQGLQVEAIVEGPIPQREDAVTVPGTAEDEEMAEQNTEFSEGEEVSF